MTDASIFKGNRCPRCAHDTLLRVGVTHYASMQLVEEVGDSQRVAPELQAYVKACGNCGYMELFSKVLVDRILHEDERLKAFGSISRSTTGQYLVTIYVSYVHKGIPASDFTVPLSPDEWMQLRLLSSISGKEDTILELLFSSAYRHAWSERVRRPLDHKLAADIARLVNSYKDDARDG